MGWHIVILYNATVSVHWQDVIRPAFEESYRFSLLNSKTTYENEQEMSLIVGSLACTLYIPLITTWWHPPGASILATGYCRANLNSAWSQAIEYRFSQISTLLAFRPISHIDVCVSSPDICCIVLGGKSEPTQWCKRSKFSALDENCSASKYKVNILPPKSDIE